MALAAGTRLGNYEITGELGAGGMGEVYRAIDTKLGREVAIKTLPSALAQDPDRLARFEREAKLLAALNHAHIAAIYGLDRHEGTQFLAMELVEGETLEERLKAGPLPVEDALRLALQIAEALEAAHEKGVVHRDLKPANVMITPQAQVKVLDFGLAKAFAGDANEASPAHSPALSLAMTQQGLILGTAGYMAPEQASGQATDQRADIWAFGVVLYEMLTGLPLFSGESVPHILADVLRAEPDWSRLPKRLHPRIRQMLERCLEKRVRSRYHSIADVRVDVEAALADPEGAKLPAELPASSRRRPRALALVAAVALTAAVSALLAWRSWPAPEEKLVTRFYYETPESEDLGSTGVPMLGLSPDGSWLIYVTRDGLNARKMDELESHSIVGGLQEVYSPAVAPNGDAVAYVDVGAQELRVVAVSGGAPSTIATGLPRVFGVSWSDDGRVFYAVSDGVYSVPSTGGEPQRVVATAEGLQAFGPQLLPDGDSLLFSVATPGDWDGGEIVIQSLSTGDRHSLITGGTSARYLPTGHIVYALGEDLYAVPFDLDTLRVTGRALRVVEGVARGLSLWQTGAAQYDVSASGTLTYVGSQTVRGRRVFLVDRSGNRTALEIEPRAYGAPGLSPDGMRIVLNEGNVPNDIWVWNTVTGTAAKLSLGPEGGDSPAWSADGARIAYHPSFGPFIDWRAASNAGTPIRLIDGGEAALDPFHPDTFDPLGRFLVFVGHATPASGWDLGLITLDDRPELRWLLHGQHSESQSSISPDGRWIAYTSDESDRSEVYVRPFPNVDDDQIPVSSRGGSEPKWSRDGRELFYIEPGAVPRLIGVGVETAGTELELGERTDLLDWPYWRSPGALARSYDVSPDGQHFVVLESLGDELDRPRVVVVENWFEEIERLVPTE